ncbi:MAG: hypothetical protein MJZ37_00245 [Bacilli bacterium]|nr:hypothetical protein [Bacilli bacterium]
MNFAKSIDKESVDETMYRVNIAHAERDGDLKRKFEIEQEYVENLKTKFLNKLHSDEVLLMTNKLIGKQYLLAGTPVIEVAIANDLIAVIEKYEKKYGFDILDKREHYDKVDDLAGDLLRYICSMHNAELIYGKTDVLKRI